MKFTVDLPHPDEVESGTDLPMFLETTSYEPSSPYSASKASSDRLVRAWLRTYGLPTIVTNCSNNYGPTIPEKLIPLVILNALEGKELPIYGKRRPKFEIGCLSKTTLAHSTK
eukprot:TRINITY_DN10767_c0_g1_i1.p1 TRINITY_DN10767_c0_g1~~TRINITY_DN10767_c0_g1_i1.p1  ORF type:complete len:113 (+),score=6.00 TRINITY_DN10767_c0_g1_i1:3-341(+)